MQDYNAVHEIFKEIKKKKKTKIVNENVDDSDVRLCDCFMIGKIYSTHIYSTEQQNPLAEKIL